MTAATVAYVRNESRRQFRNRRAMIFSIVIPLVLFEVLASTSGSSGSYRPYGLDVAAFYLVSMITFGTLNAVFSTGGRIALERTAGWNRQLRLTALAGWQYVAGKVATGFVTAVPVLVVLCVAAGASGKVHLSAVRWIAIVVSVLPALLPIAALGVWVGYIATADSIQTVSGIASSLLSLLGGIWFPFSGWLRQASEALPSYWIAAAGRTALQGGWVGWHGVAVLAAWTVVFTALAGRAYRRDTERN